MVKAVALDTNVAIKILNEDPFFLNVASNYDVLYLSVTVEGELLFGALNSSQRVQNLIKLKGFIGHCLILTITSAVAEQYAVVRQQLKKKGKPIPENEIWIASTCLVNKLPLATVDKHFGFIKGLSLETQNI